MSNDAVEMNTVPRPACWVRVSTVLIRLDEKWDDDSR